MYPDWVEKHKGKGKEIKHIRGKYYLYERTTVWDKEKKMPKKISGAYLGRITPEGLIEPKKKMTDIVKVTEESVPNKEYGASEYLCNKGADIIEKLKRYFPEIWKTIFVMAALRVIEPQPFKRIEEAYLYSYLSVVYPGINLSKNSISGLLQELGNSRTQIVEFMKAYVSGSEHLIFDGTRITTYSREMDMAQVGYNHKRTYDPQVNLLYAFATCPEAMPMYYRVVPGNICDVTAFRVCVEESGLNNSIIIADKGFGSRANFNMLEENGLKYIVPLRRSCKEFDAERIRSGYADGFEDFFMFNDRPIWYFRNADCTTYIDGELRLREETDYIRRIEENRDGYDKQGYMESRLKFGTIILRSNTDLQPKELYETYKKRAAIEQSFDTLKNLLEQDTSYMQSDVAFEAWSFINHISLMLSYLLYNEMKNKDLLKKYSLSDALTLLSHQRMLYLNGKWVPSEVSKKSRELCLALYR